MVINSSASFTVGVNGFSTMTLTLSISLLSEQTRALDLSTVLSILQCHLRELEVRVWYCRHDHNVHLGILDHLLSRAVTLDAWMIFLGIVVRLRGSLDNSKELEFWDDVDEGNVEDFGRHAIANYSDVIGLGGH